MKQVTTNRRQSPRGQALLETILVVPLLLLIIFNSVNFAYFFLMAIDLTSASRSGALYSINGSATPSATALPNAGPTGTNTTVSYLVYQDLTGSVNSPTTAAGVQVCSPQVGTLGAGTTTQRSQCQTFGSVGSFTAASPDPELNASNTAPAFMLNRVDVAYQFSPPIPITPFNLLLLMSSACSNSGGTVTCTFYRHAEMRAMN